MVARVLSGGQTGVDRASLDAAIELGIPCGGWCPKGRQAEDGTIADRQPADSLEHSRFGRNRESQPAARC